MIGEVLMGKNMNKQFSGRFKEAVYLFEKGRVVFHVFKPIHDVFQILQTKNKQSVKINKTHY